LHTLTFAAGAAVARLQKAATMMAGVNLIFVGLRFRDFSV
jgi:hypothetical protein